MIVMSTAYTYAQTRRYLKKKTTSKILLGQKHHNIYCKIRVKKVKMVLWSQEYSSKRRTNMKTRKL